MERKIPPLREDPEGRDARINHDDNYINIELHGIYSNQINTNRIQLVRV